MGFQFNHVGGGTKTRRPITLHMVYNSACIEPSCYLMTEDQGEIEVTLEELQVCEWPPFLRSRAPGVSPSAPALPSRVSGLH